MSSKYAVESTIVTREDDNGIGVKSQILNQKSFHKHNIIHRTLQRLRSLPVRDSAQHRSLVTASAGRTRNSHQRRRRLWPHHRPRRLLPVIYEIRSPAPDPIVARSRASEPVPYPVGLAIMWHSRRCAALAESVSSIRHFWRSVE